MIARLEDKQLRTKHRTNTESNNGSNNQHQINNNITTTLPKLPGRGLNALNWYQIVALYSATVEAQKCLARMEDS